MQLQQEVARPLNGKKLELTRLLTPENALGTLELGFKGQRTQQILLINASGIQTGGPVTQLLQIGKGCAELFTGCDHIPVGFIGARPETAGDNLMRGFLPESLNDFQFGTDSVPERFQTVIDAMTGSFAALAAAGSRNLLLVSNGYTAYVPFGVKHAAATVAAALRPQAFKVKLLMQDSSFPDTDNRSFATDERGLPLDRFHAPAYSSSSEVDIYFGCNNWLPIDLNEDAGRAPTGATCFRCFLPFAPSVVDSLVDAREQIPKELGRAKTAVLVQNAGFTELARLIADRRNIMIPLIASEGCFDINNVGRWMTTAQFKDVQEGSRLLVESLSRLSERLGKNIVCPGVGGFVAMVEQLIDQGALEHSPTPITVVKKGTELPRTRHGSQLFVAETPEFSYQDYPYFKRASDCTVHRSSQANSHAEDVLMGIPTVLITMPAHNYMSVGSMDVKFHGRQFFPDAKPQMIEQVLSDTLADPHPVIGYQDRLMAYSLRSPGSNFWRIVSHLAGVSLNGKTSLGIPGDDLEHCHRISLIRE